MPIGHTVVEVWPFFIFLKIAAVRHLEFLKVLFNIVYLPVWFRETICVILPNILLIGQTVPEMFFLLILQRGGRTPSWMCFTLFGPPTKSIWLFLSLCKIWL